jgi:hypothetical protein
MFAKSYDFRSRDDHEISLQAHSIWEIVARLMVVTTVDDTIPLVLANRVE